eukprot:TRINITY_DN124070_c0_g1_i1.p1 TRINITY_DN124070_c0_g1~~TRINITY_DN124070_c0_g1_i1.p1  ORF type:complete len:547 (+),score=93.36 TRINITY_DN124070_c0_g1_i1:76-1716(+)
MTHYALAYACGRQFVFEERTRWSPMGLTFYVLCGLLVGLFVFTAVTFVDAFTFEVAIVVLMTFSLGRMYFLNFKCVSSSVDTAGFIFGGLLLSVALASVLGAIRCSLYFELAVRQRLYLFSGAGIVLAATFHTFASLCCQEDERKHQLSCCGGGSSTQKLAAGGGDVLGIGTCLAESDKDAASTPEALERFATWIWTWQWWEDISFKRPGSEDIESMSSDDVGCITLHNNSLKLIKVCFYAQDDLLCWVPFGGVSGRGVGFVHAEQCRSFFLPKKYGNADSYIMKVFQPSLFDKELACYRVQSGAIMTFFDVEGMAKRSRLLSSSSSGSSTRRSTSDSDLVTESSEDELGLADMSRSGADRLRTCSADASSVALTRLSPGAGHCGLRRSSSAQHLPFQRAVTSPDRPVSLDSAECQSWLKASTSQMCGLSTSAGSQAASRLSSKCSRDERSACLRLRQAGQDEVVIRNRGSDEVRVSLFRSNDYLFAVPMLSDLVPPNGERRFQPKDRMAADFTLKVYSVGPASKELTYLTVARGCTYKLFDSLLS